MGKSVWHFLKQNGWLLNVFCTLSVLSWRQDSLQSKAPRYFWHCFGLRCLSVKRCFTELLVVWDLIKNQQREPSLGYIPLPSERFFSSALHPSQHLRVRAAFWQLPAWIRQGGQEQSPWFGSLLLSYSYAGPVIICSYPGEVTLWHFF